MKKLLSCTLILVIILIGAGIYFHKTRTICGFETANGTKIIEACQCYGLPIPLSPTAGEVDLGSIVGGKYIYCYGFTKLQACKIAPDAALTDLQKFICKDLLK